MQRTEKAGSEKGKLFPTDIGCVVNDFLLEHFANIMDYNFTATVEKDFDEIAAGKKEWRKVIDSFYVPFHKNIRQTQQNSQRTTGSRLLGTDPRTGKNVYAKIGRYGTLVQIGETNTDEKPLFASMKKGQSIETITLEEALGLFALPRTVGTYEEKDVTVSIGKYGPYVRHDDKFYSLGKSDDPYDVTLERCIAIIESKRKSEQKKEDLKKVFPLQIGVHEGEVVMSNNGKYGPYLTYKGENYRLPKEADVLKLTLKQALEIIEKAEEKKAKRVKS
jgi:DNA topoisomerase-1